MLLLYHLVGITSVLVGSELLGCINLDGLLGVAILSSIYFYVGVIVVFPVAAAITYILYSFVEHLDPINELYKQRNMALRKNRAKSRQ